MESINAENGPIVGADIYIRMADSYYYAMGTEQDLEKALAYYQIAERLYWTRLQDGDFLIKKQYERAIEMQAKVREELMRNLPGFDWVNGEGE